MYPVRLAVMSRLTNEGSKPAVSTRVAGDRETPVLRVPPKLNIFRWVSTLRESWHKTNGEDFACVHESARNFQSRAIRAHVH